MYDANDTPLVTETLLKKRRSLEELAVVRSDRLGQEVKRKRVVRGENVRITRPERLVKARRMKEASERKLNRKRSKVNTKNEKDRLKTTVGFVIRILEGKNSSKAVLNELKKLGLNQKYDGAFYKLDEQGLRAMKPLEDYVAYGYISLKMVEELVHRRAFVVVDGVKTALSDNITVENLLGEHDLICLGDLSQEIYNIGDKYSLATKILAPFALSSPAGNFEKKMLHVAADRRGFLGDDMDDFLKKLL